MQANAHGFNHNIASEGDCSMHLIQQEEPSEEFRAAWVAAGRHIQSQCDSGLNWIRADLNMPFIEHLSFRLGNQLFFVFIEAAEVQLAYRYDGFISLSKSANATPCVLKMGKAVAAYEPTNSGWGLTHAVTNEPVDPIEVVSEELIEMSDWELHDFAISVVKGKLQKEGKNVYSTCSDFGINPSLWFEENGQDHWVVINEYRHPHSFNGPPEDIDQIAEFVSARNATGYFAIVGVVNNDDPFDPDARVNGNYLPLYRGHAMFVKFTGIEAV